ncbi:MAG TPA: 1,4-alpha-glucan branching protein GlgB [Dehalococcoidales bacterium]|nr:1,4-alpha-glucan branching protein GlgB [Dehalococcoidales bacterium]
MSESRNKTRVVRYDISLLTDLDIHLFNEGRHFQLYDRLGAHILDLKGVKGTYFAVWAPNASQVSVTGDFNKWDKQSHRLKAREQSGLWEGFIPNLAQGAVYKYHIQSKNNNFEVDKADPLAFYSQVPPDTASVVRSLDFQWSDQEWMSRQPESNSLSAPMSIYEIHAGSWRRKDDNQPLSYRELGPQLADYVKKMGFTHVEFLPLMEHPFSGSWGYQITDYFAPTSRYGTPQDLMYLIDYLHRQGIGVILDWVPSHFPDNEHGLVFFDGTRLYEHPDLRRGFHPDWHSYVFNYGRKEVQSFLISSALFWLDRYHADGLRVDAVASMLYLDYSRKPGEWEPNQHGGRENLEAIAFLKSLNEQVYRFFPGVQTMAEESTAWPLVSRPTHIGGLGFGLKWDMGWMHDTLLFMAQDPVFRKYHINKLTFRQWYAFRENFLLPLSHDEVVYGKSSLLNKMPGSAKQKLANLRLMLSYMFAVPGKKLLFMGAELGQWQEWNHDGKLDWHLLEQAGHAGLSLFVSDLNRTYRREKAFYEGVYVESGFKWIDFADVEKSTLSFMRCGQDPAEVVLVVLNFTPVPRFDYRIGCPSGGEWLEILNSDALEYSGDGFGNYGRVQAEPVPFHSLAYSLRLSLPPLGALFLKPAHPPEKST